MPEIPAQAQSATLHLHDLGRLDYSAALTMQRTLQREVIEARDARNTNAPQVGHLMVLEHDPPVITLTRRPQSRTHLIADDHQRRDAGVELAETDRGGDITYHGPGQLVAYPILDLNRLDLRLGSYMRWLEQIVIDVLASFSIDGMRDPAAPGVWVRPSPTNVRTPTPPSIQMIGTTECLQHPPAKICAMGVRIARWVSMHGMALNVTTNLEHFKLIVPCGLAGRDVTSLQRELGAQCPTIERVKLRLADQFQREITRRLDLLSP